MPGSTVWFNPGAYDPDVPAGFIRTSIHYRGRRWDLTSLPDWVEHMAACPHPPEARAGMNGSACVRCGSYVGYPGRVK